MHSNTSPSSIFKGCTLRFACFCKQSFLRFTPENGPRKLFFTCRTNPPAKIAKRIPRSCQKRLQNPPLDALKTRPRGLRIQSSFKITFCAGHSQRGALLACPRTWTGDPDYIDIYIYIYIYIYHIYVYYIYIYVYILMDWACCEKVPRNSSIIRPYPKPTQVD